jgi:hypothetical protein
MHCQCTKGTWREGGIGASAVHGVHEQPLKRTLHYNWREKEGKEGTERGIGMRAPRVYNCLKARGELGGGGGEWEDVQAVIETSCIDVDTKKLRRNIGKRLREVDVYLE